MELRLASVVDLLVARHGIRSEAKSAFLGRFQHLRRIGFPSGVNTGKGKKFAYGWKQVMELCVAFDMIELGVPPDLAASTIQSNEQGLADAAYLLIEQFRDQTDFSASVAPDGRHAAASPIIAVRMDSLMTLKSPDSKRDATFVAWTTSELMQRLQGQDAFEPGYLLINFGQRVLQLLWAAPSITGIDPEEIFTSFWAWCEEQGTRVLEGL